MIRDIDDHGLHVIVTVDGEHEAWTIEMVAEHLDALRSERDAAIARAEKAEQPPLLIVAGLRADLREALARAERAEAERDGALADKDDQVRRKRASAERLAEVEAERDKARAALEKIDGIRNSIVGRQSINWSMHIYPLVAALDEAGYGGEGYDVASAKVQAETDAWVAELNGAFAALRSSLTALEARWRREAKDQRPDWAAAKLVAADELRALSREPEENGETSG